MRIVSSMSKYPKNAIIAKERYIRTVDAPQECISAGIAWQITSMMSIKHSKDAS